MRSDAPTPAPAAFGLWQGLLALAPPPALGENIRGYVRRLAIANGHVGVSMFTEAIGVVGIGPIGSGAAWERLRQATGLPFASLEPMRWVGTRDARGSRLRFLGHELARGHVRPNSFRICPVCLREDGIVRDFWCLTMAAACPRHGTLLAEACSACGRGFRTALVGPADGCRCSLPFIEVATTPAPAAALRAAKNLALLIGPAAIGEADPSWHLDLPAAFEALELFDYMSYLEVLGRAGSVPAADDRPASSTSRGYRSANLHEQLDIGHTLSLLEAADQIIAGWPRSFDQLLDQVTARGCASGGESTLKRAYSTDAGRLLLYAPRGANGVPLRLMLEAVIDHWRRRGGKARKRKLIVINMTAHALRGHFHAAWLAKTVGSDATWLHRVVQRVLDSLTDVEQTMPQDVLVALAQDRAVALYRAAFGALSLAQAKRVLEGSQYKDRLVGWDHPELIQPDPMLRDLRDQGEFYRREAVVGLLERMGRLATKIDAPGALVPLFPVGLRGLRRPRPSKTEILLRIFRGQLAVATLVTAPKLGDLLVNTTNLNNGIAKEAFLARHALNVVMAERYGDGPVLTIAELQRLFRIGSVRTQRHFRRFNRNGRPRNVVRFNVDDVDSVVQRRRHGTLSALEAAALGPEINVRPLIVQLSAAGHSPTSIATELSRLGMVTTRGRPWHANAVRNALHGDQDQPVLATQLPEPGPWPVSL
jgi:hypothetical protein